MFGLKKKTAASSAASPAHPEAESGLRSRRTSSEPIPAGQGFEDSPAGLENKSTQELESYAVHKAEETTKSVNNCLKIAEDIREDATHTLETLHQQGEQIHRTHQMAAGIDQDLSKGEKLLNSLGGMFSKPWKPKKTRSVTGPLSTCLCLLINVFIMNIVVFLLTIIRLACMIYNDFLFMNRADEPSKSATKEQKDKLKGAPVPKGKPSNKTPPTGQSAAMQKVEVEKEQQDEALSDLSNILGDLKGMASDMGSELDRQNKALDHLDTDIDELNTRVKGANQRARHLLNK